MTRRVIQRLIAFLVWLDSVLALTVIVAVLT